MTQCRLLGGTLRLRPGTTTQSRALPRPISDRRSISSSFLEKKRLANLDWSQKAEEIKLGTRRNMYEILEDRGYIQNTAGTPKLIKEILRTKRIGVYAGVDPTADSLHLGHLLPFMVVFWMWMHGYQGVTLIGGATARMGDPTGRTEDRPILPNAEIAKNITKVHYQLKALWANVVATARRYQYEPHWGGTHRLINNNMWLQSLPMYEVMKRLARHARLGPMLARDSVKERMKSGQGMSCAEFLYPLVQGWDWWHMYNKLGVQMQVGGQDQYGNIVAGIDFVKTIRASEESDYAAMPTGHMNEPIGITVPLLTDASGAKFGKSAGNAIWLDQYKTSAFDLYGYFMRRPDDQVEQLLKLLTFMPKDKISELMEEHGKDPTKRVAHHALGFEVLCTVHGVETAIREQQQHVSLFNKPDVQIPMLGSEVRPQPGKAPMEASYNEDGDEYTVPMVVTATNAPQQDLQLPISVIKEGSMAAIFYHAGMVPSRSVAHQLLKQNGLYVAGQPGKEKRGLIPGNLDWKPAKLWFTDDLNNFMIDGRLLILRRGKHNVRIIEVVSDEAYRASGQKYPGMPGTGRVRSMAEQIHAMAKESGLQVEPHRLKRELVSRILEANKKHSSVTDDDLKNVMKKLAIKKDEFLPASSSSESKW